MCLGLTLAAREHFRELTLLRRVRDHIDRNPARPLDLEALAHLANLPALRFVDRFRLAYGLSPHAYQRAAQAVRDGRTLTIRRVLENR
jgi:AraC-like DNA-binding protein